MFTSKIIIVIIPLTSISHPETEPSPILIVRLAETPL